MLRLLFIEDVEVDTRLLLSELARAGQAVEWERVETRDALARALDESDWDAIISDLRLHSFSGPEALALCRERDLDLPFIIVADAVNEAELLEAFEAGAHDVIDRRNPARLRPVLARALREAESRRARRRAARALAASEARYRQLLESVPAIVWGADPQNLQFNFVNAEAEAILCYPAARWREPGFLQERLHPEDREGTLASLRRVVERRQSHHQGEYRMMSADGRTVWLHGVASLVSVEGQASELIGVMIDVSERHTPQAPALDAVAPSV